MGFPLPAVPYLAKNLSGLKIFRSLSFIHRELLIFPSYFLSIFDRESFLFFLLFKTFPLCQSSLLQRMPYSRKLLVGVVVFKNNYFFKFKYNSPFFFIKKTRFTSNKYYLIRRYQPTKIISLFQIVVQPNLCHFMFVQILFP